MARPRPVRLEELERRDTPTFTPLTPFTTGLNGPTAATAGDFNRDGKADLAVGNFPSDPTIPPSVSILLGNGDGSFTAAPPITAVDGPVRAIVVADFNRDTLQDLAVADAGPGSTTLVFLGLGNGTFTPPTFANVVGAAATAAADFTGDGILDLVSLDFGVNGSVFDVFAGKGDGTFSPAAPPIPTTASSQRIVTADFDGDGHQDFAALDSFGGGLLTYYGQGNGRFDPVVGTPLSATPAFDLAAGDFDGDGRTDVVVTEDARPVFRRNLGGRVFDPAGVPIPVSSVTTLVRLASTDFDGNGLPDIVTFDFSSNGSVAYSLGGGNFAQDPGNPYALPLSAVDVTTGDFDGDLNPDFAAVAASSAGDSGQVFLNRAPDRTVTALAAAPNPATFGQTVTLTATVTPTVPPFPPGQPAPTGTVTFLLTNGTALGPPVPLNGPTAALPVSGLAPGTYQVFANYSGDTLYVPSSSPVITVVVNPIPTATAAAVVPNPSTFGQPATLSAVLTPAVPPGAVVPPATGTVTFTVNGVPVGSAPVSGNAASIPAPFRIAGFYPVVAVYSGDANYQPSTAPAITWTVNPAPTALAAAVSPNPSTFGQPAALTATLTPAVPPGTAPAPTGVVLFTVDGVVVTSAPLVNNSANFPAPSLPVGSHQVVATYSGDANYQTSASPAVTWVVNPAPTSLVVDVSPNPSAFGQPATLTAKLSPAVFPGTSPAATGTVTFSVNGVVVGSAPVTTNTATIPAPPQAAGSYPVVAVYSGDVNYQGSAAPAVTWVVNRAITALYVAVTPNPSTFGQPATLTATLLNAAPPGTTPAPTGTVTFGVNGVTVGSAPLTGNTASIPAPPQPPGSYPVTATYSGDVNYQPSTAGTIFQDVARAPTTAALSVDQNPTPPGQPLVFTAVVSGGGLTPAPTGTVTVSDGTTVLGSGALQPNGTAVITVANPPAGARSVTATYSGDANYAGSTSPAVAVNVLSAVPPAPQTFLVGSDAGGVVCVLEASAALQHGVQSFGPGFTAARVAGADFNGDGLLDMAVGSGRGDPSGLLIVDGATKLPVIGLSPFGTDFTGGVFVAAGDIDGDGVPDVAAAADDGGPRVRVFLTRGTTLVPVTDFFAFADGFRGGTRVAIGDVNGDGLGDLVVAPGPGGGPRVATFDGRSLVAGSPARLFNDFYAFDPASRVGAFVAVGDVTGDGFGEIVVGADTGGGPRVSVFDGATLSTTGVPVVVANFFAGDPNSRGGVRVAARDLDLDGRADLLTGAGVGDGSQVRVYSGALVTVASDPAPNTAADSFPGLTGGVYVG